MMRRDFQKIGVTEFISFICTSVTTSFSSLFLEVAEEELDRCCHFLCQRSEQTMILVVHSRRHGGIQGCEYNTVRQICTASHTILLSSKHCCVRPQQTKSVQRRYVDAASAIAAEI